MHLAGGSSSGEARGTANRPRSASALWTKTTRSTIVSTMTNASFVRSLRPVTKSSEGTLSRLMNFPAEQINQSRLATYCRQLAQA